jgi:adenylate kinase family enzyme
MHTGLVEKAKKVEDLSPDNIEKQMQEMRGKNMECLKTMIWDMHPKLMNLFRENQVLIELEETLDTVKEYFSEDAKKNFKDEVDEIDILNKNGHFAYVCSKMDYYKDLEQRMGDATVRINKAAQRAKILVKKLTNFKLNKDFLKKMLVEEFKKRNLDCNAAPKKTEPHQKINLVDSNNAQSKFYHSL